VKAALEWVERNPACGISLASVDGLPGFGHKITTLTSSAAERARKLEQTLGVKVDFDFLS
jgi:hypothetical protein